MSAFMQGLQAGSQTARGWLDTYERSRDRREAEELKRRREEIMGAQPEDLGLRYSPEQAEQLRLAAESGQYDIGYGDGGYQVTPTADPRQTGLVAPEQQVSRFMGQEVEGQMTPQQVAQMREQALVDTIADPMERQRAVQGLRQGRLTDMQIAEAERGMQVREATQQAQQALSQRIAQGDIPDVEEIFGIASQTGADANELLQVTANALGISDKKAKADADKLAKEINESAVNPKKFNELLRKFDPNPEDNIVPELRVGRDGTHQVFYGEEPMSPAFSNTREMTAMAQLASHYRDSVSGAPLATSIQLATLKVKEAQIREANARTEGLSREKLTPAERNIAAAERLGLPLSDTQRLAMLGVGTADLSPQRAALQKVYLEQAKQLPPGDSRAGQALAAAITQLYTDQATETRSAEVVESVSAAHKQGRGADALAMLRRQGFAEPSVKSIADRAGVPYTPPPAGATPAEADTPTQPGLARQPVQLLSPLYRAQDWARRQNELNAEQFDPSSNPYGGLR